MLKLKNQIQIVGLQRSGTNYVEDIILRNSLDSCFLTHRHFDQQLSKFHYYSYGFWKHTLEPSSDIMYPNIDHVVVVYKNPMLWIESIAFRNSVDYPFFQRKYPAFSVTEDSINIGPKKFNLLNLIKTYNHHYEYWILKPHQFSTRSILVDYRDLLEECHIQSFFQKLNLTIKENVKTPDFLSLRFSQKINYDKYNYTPDQLTRYKNNETFLLTDNEKNFILEHLSPAVLKQFNL